MEREDEAATALLIRHLTGEARSSIASLSSAALLGASDRDLAALGDGSKSLRGPWGYRVGLVGKPSAGKSSLFNALTRAGFYVPSSSPSAASTPSSSSCISSDMAAGDGGEAAAETADDEDGTASAAAAALARQGWGEGTAVAKVGAAPFTTIDPNVGVARYAAPHDSEPADLIAQRKPTAYGRSDDGRRLLPCTLIDVAGLVPGAYTGKGKGNQFLADLCTADALIHVVDASGMTDDGGHPTERAFACAADNEGRPVPRAAVVPMAATTAMMPRMRRPRSSGLREIHLGYIPTSS